MVKADAAKLHALFWTTPAIPRGSHSPHLSASCSPSWSLKDRVQGGGQLLEAMNGLDTLRPLRQEHSHSLTHFNVPGTGHHLPVPTAQMSLKIPGLPLQGSPSRDPW